MRSQLVNATKHDYYTVPEAAEMLSVSPSTIWRWIKSGKLPAYRVGERSIRIKRVDLEGMISPVSTSEEPRRPFEDYNAEAVLAAIDETAGSWSDVNIDEFIDDLYAAREQGSRSATRP